MPRPQFTLRALLVLMFGAASFFGGMRCEREYARQRYDASLDVEKRQLEADIRAMQGLLDQIASVNADERAEDSPAEEVASDAW